MSLKDFHEFQFFVEIFSIEFLKINNIKRF